MGVLLERIAQLLFQGIVHPVRFQPAVAFA